VYTVGLCCRVNGKVYVPSKDIFILIERLQLTSLQDLNCLATRYLEPLKEESFLSDDDMQQLFGNIQDIIRFQKLFLDELERSLSDSDDVKVHFYILRKLNHHSVICK